VKKAEKLAEEAADADTGGEEADKPTETENRSATGKRKTSRHGLTMRSPNTRTMAVGAERGYANCTDAVYGALFDSTAQQIKLSKGLAKSHNLREARETDELVSVMFAESLSRKRIEAEQPHGNSACVSDTRKSAAVVRKAIEANRT
jgi:hypothetical protein